MKKIIFLLTISFFFITGCYDPDPPLLTTPLPNGYTFDSNGGLYGYIKTPGGKRMAEHFGIISNEVEAWCEEFAWQESIVICNLQEMRAENNKIENVKGYFILDTSSSEITKLYSKKMANEYWKKKLGSDMPELKHNHKQTKEK